MTRRDRFQLSRRNKLAGEPSAGPAYYSADPTAGIKSNWAATMTAQLYLH